LYKLHLVGYIKYTAVSVVTDCLHYCEIFIVYIKYEIVAAGRLIEFGEPRIGDP